MLRLVVAYYVNGIEGATCDYDCPLVVGHRRHLGDLVEIFGMLDCIVVVKVGNVGTESAIFLRKYQSADVCNLIRILHGTIVVGVRNPQILQVDDLVGTVVKFYKVAATRIRIKQQFVYCQVVIFSLNTNTKPNLRINLDIVSAAVGNIFADVEHIDLATLYFGVELHFYNCKLRLNNFHKCRIPKFLDTEILRTNHFRQNNFAEIHDHGIVYHFGIGRIWQNPVGIGCVDRVLCSRRTTATVESRTPVGCTFARIVEVNHFERVAALCLEVVVVPRRRESERMNYVSVLVGQRNRCSALRKRRHTINTDNIFKIFKKEGIIGRCKHQIRLGIYDYRRQSLGR